MKILAISARLPYPLDTGAKIRSFHILKSLAEKHELTLLSFIGSAEEAQHLSYLKSHGINVTTVLNPEIDKGISARIFLKCLISAYPLTVGKYTNRSFRLEFQRLQRKQFDLIHCEHFHMAQYISADFTTCKTFDAHNVESEVVHRLHAQEINFFRKLILAWHAKRTTRYEIESLKKFDLIMAVSERDKNTLRILSSIQNIKTIENGVDTDFFSPKGDPNSKDIVFVGSMDWWPNDDGIRFFIETVFPLILSKSSTTHLFVVGRKPSQGLQSIAKTFQGKVIVTGAVNDVRPYIEKASVYVVPLRVGGGTRLKVLEAFAMGKAVVSTSLGSEGIAYSHGENIIIEDKPADFAEAILKLLENQDLRVKLGTNAVSLAVERYSWKKIAEKLQSVYDNQKALQ